MILWKWMYIQKEIDKGRITQNQIDPGSHCECRPNKYPYPPRKRKILNKKNSVSTQYSFLSFDWTESRDSIFWFLLRSKIKHPQEELNGSYNCRLFLTIDDICTNVLRECWFERLLASYSIAEHEKGINNIVCILMVHRYNRNPRGLWCWL